MIRIQKDYKKVPEKLKSKACLKQIEMVLKEKENHKFASYHYRDGCLAELQTLYHQKCAYCETDPSTGSSLQVEHFRGKDKNSRNTKDSEDRHAYYWLAYEWSNLLLMCSKCNGAKSDYFPLAVDGVRVLKPVTNTAGELVQIMDSAGDLLYFEHQLHDAPHFLAEKPLLLNPEVDFVEQHYIINSSGEWKPLTEQAKKTKEICKLDRIELVLARSKCIIDFASKLKTHLKAYFQKVTQKDAFEWYINHEFSDLKTKIKPNVPYSRTYWFMFYKFEKVVLPHITQDEHKKIILDLFKNFLKQGYI
jgi:5-methylcytosine-specific restriction endonuclease McrA